MERICDCDCDCPIYHNQPRAWLSRAAAWTAGGEKRGMTPIPADERTDKRFASIFFVWFTMSTNLLPIITGMVGTLVFGIGLRDCSLLILFFSLMCALPAGYFSTFGSRTGLRQMLHARYTFGYYLISIIVVLNLCTIAGFGVIDCVLGGSTLAAASAGKLDATAGIVVIALVSMVVCFGGIRVIHAYERYSWVFALLAITIATGVGGKHLASQAETAPAEAATLVGFGGVVAGFLIPWAAMAADFSVYCDASASTLRIFAYTYAGLFFPTVPLMVLGAAIGGATPNMPEWAAGYAEHSVGGVLQAMLLPAGGFGRFVAVLLSLTVIGNLTTAMYSISLSFQLVLPVLVKIPRVVFVMVYTAVAIPVAIEAAKSFFAALENFIYLIAYWSAAFVAVVSAEHFVFRRGDCAAYDVAHWDQPSKLPTGLAAIGAMGLSFGLAVPCMSQVWYTGPLAKETGDIGFEVALVLAAILYLPLRWIELKYRPF
ncbi:permease for cytosine/purines, uracil, thiamine, allantoin-domain-containing protein [Lasiosphaeria miniovina]|uniref:Permease for cytosine/purines, uracil, thiamine, allantoin-domain-containing protein n=1 Tax=Lasiosphaeria miniovina TaxID=1954250 RepID=A0AA40A4T7_9PEZI|nr:permease for cytosine/purines, uracil, thiamine, allantoin-domain-containing protein [Lasiosphaeria miniovina]KAK0709289.1 permease for cytosine/purines, uracil, thiamine, allantoin-domain-containing protein [Lasiosphaeria miniovina]